MPEVEIALESGTQRQGKCVKLRGTSVLIGRTRRCSIRLTDEASSSEHAALMLDGGVWYLRDLGSHDGTFVNGYPVRSIAMHVGDEVRFGESGALVRILGMSPAPPEDEIPVLAPVAGPPTVVGLRRGRSWIGAVALFVIVGALVLASLVRGNELRPMARAETPRALFDVVTRAVRERHHENVFDILSGRIQREIELSLAGSEAADVGVREAIRVAGRADGRLLIDWAVHVSTDLAPDGLSGTLVTKNRDGEERTNRIVLESGGWRLDEPAFRLKSRPDTDR
jgi:pSer/pThr/pTyr-binding forkhead associated (FHA) protein